MLLAARDADTGQGMTDRELRDEVITTFAAGHETTAITLTWAFYLLSRHREVLERVQREVDGVLGKEELPTPDDLAAMPYTLRVFEEALRLYPSAPILPRLVQRDTELGGYRVPAGSRVLVNLYDIHRHPRHWPDPERFDPDRFLPEAGKGAIASRICRSARGRTSASGSTSRSWRPICCCAPWCAAGSSAMFPLTGW